MVDGRLSMGAEVRHREGAGHVENQAHSPDPLQLYGCICYRYSGLEAPAHSRNSPSQCSAVTCSFSFPSLYKVSPGSCSRTALLLISLPGKSMLEGLSFEKLRLELYLREAKTHWPFPLSVHISKVGGGDLLS